MTKDIRLPNKAEPVATFEANWLNQKSGESNSIHRTAEELPDCIVEIDGENVTNSSIEYEMSNVGISAIMIKSSIEGMGSRDCTVYGLVLQIRRHYRRSLDRQEGNQCSGHDESLRRVRYSRQTFSAARLRHPKNLGDGCEQCWRAWGSDTLEQVSTVL